MSECLLPPPSVDPSAWEDVTDPEGCFTLAMPRGWQNRSWLHRGSQIPHSLATSTSPGGEAAIFFGDSTIPRFVEPAAIVFAPPPGLVPRPYTPIEHFLPGYVQQRFGRLAGFRPARMAPLPELFNLVVRKARSAGAVQLWCTAAQ